MHIFAIAKALHVALYFMHVRYETRTLVTIVSVLALMAVMLAFGATPDAVWKLP